MEMPNRDGFHSKGLNSTALFSLVCTWGSVILVAPRHFRTRLDVVICVKSIVVVEPEDQTSTVSTCSNLGPLPTRSNLLEYSLFKLGHRNYLCWHQPHRGGYSRDQNIISHVGYQRFLPLPWQ
jgi:hypothetical protein